MAKLLLQLDDGNTDLSEKGQQKFLVWIRGGGQLFLAMSLSYF